MKRLAIAALALTLASVLAGCGDDDSKSDPAPTPSEPTSETSTEPTTPEPTWDDKFTPAQMKRYEKARDTWLEFWDFYTEIARKGVDNPGVLRGFEKYTVAALVERSEYLDTFVRGGARMEVPPEVLWTNATKITKNAVDFNYCLDYTDARIVTNGTISDISNPSRRLGSIRMRKTSKGWLKEGRDNGGIKKCSATVP